MGECKVLNEPLTTTDANVNMEGSTTTPMKAATKGSPMATTIPITGLMNTLESTTPMDPDTGSANVEGLLMMSILGENLGGLGNIQMASPPSSPLQNQGASHTTGGIFHGQALGNVFNFADAKDKVREGPIMGKVFIYTEHVTPTQSHPFMSLKHEVLNHLGPILKKLATHYPVVSGKFGLHNS